MTPAGFRFPHDEHTVPPAIGVIGAPIGDCHPVPAAYLADPRAWNPATVMKIPGNSPKPPTNTIHIESSSKLVIDRMPTMSRAAEPTMIRIPSGMRIRALRASR